MNGSFAVPATLMYCAKSVHTCLRSVRYICVTTSCNAQVTHDGVDGCSPIATSLLQWVRGWLCVGRDREGASATSAT